jgi:hypothetical protein
MPRVKLSPEDKKAAMKANQQKWLNKVREEYNAKYRVKSLQYYYAHHDELKKKNLERYHRKKNEDMEFFDCLEEKK